MDTTETKELHIERINNAIDAILNIEEYYDQMPSDLTKAISKLNSLRSLAEEDMVYNAFDGTIAKVEKVLYKNLVLEGRKEMIGKKYCFKRHY